MTSFFYRHYKKLFLFSKIMCILDIFYSVALGVYSGMSTPSLILKIEKYYLPLFTPPNFFTLLLVNCCARHWVNWLIFSNRICISKTFQPDISINRRVNFVYHNFGDVYQFISHSSKIILLKRYCYLTPKQWNIQFKCIWPLGLCLGH